MAGTHITGVSPDARTCPRCGRKIGGFYMAGRFQMIAHNRPEGGKCRAPKRAPVTGAILP